MGYALCCIHRRPSIQNPDRGASIIFALMRFPRVKAWAKEKKRTDKSIPNLLAARSEVDRKVRSEENDGDTQKNQNPESGATLETKGKKGFLEVLLTHIPK